MTLARFITHACMIGMIALGIAAGLLATDPETAADLVAKFVEVQE